MTVQEAIEILRDTPIDIKSTRDDDIHTLYATAQGMAIEALQRGLENVNADSCSEEPNRSDLVKESGDLVKDLVNDCISRQDAIDACKHAWAKGLEPSQYIELIPSAQPEDVIHITRRRKFVSEFDFDEDEPERKKGEWIHKPDIYLDEQTWKCSECGEPWIFIEGTPSENNANFCPNCGADMR